jgi:branched-chain amino acid aminotransferase
VKSDLVWMDGELVPYDQATVHVLNPTMHYGTGVFEGIRCYQTENGPAVFRLHEHMERFMNSVAITGVREFPYDIDELITAVHQTIIANHFSSCYIRPLMYMLGPLGLNLDAWRPAVSIAVWEWDPFLGKDSASKGVDVAVSSFTRHHPNVMMTKAKISGNYVNSTLAKTMAQRTGFDEAVMLDPNGYVSECSGENIYIVRDGVIYTPPRNSILEGITRDSLLTLARDNGIQVVEEPIARDHLYIADEIFLSGTAAEVVPVRSVDFRPVGRYHDSTNGAIKVVNVLQEAFFNTVKGNGKRSAEWLDYVRITEEVEKKVI